jgi:hypothetical protein
VPRSHRVSSLSPLIETAAASRHSHRPLHCCVTSAHRSARTRHPEARQVVTSHGWRRQARRQRPPLRQRVQQGDTAVEIVAERARGQSGPASARRSAQTWQCATSHGDNVTVTVGIVVIASMTVVITVVMTVITAIVDRYHRAAASSSTSPAPAACRRHSTLLRHPRHYHHRWEPQFPLLTPSLSVPPPATVLGSSFYLSSSLSVMPTITHQPESLSSGYTSSAELCDVDI